MKNKRKPSKANAVIKNEIAVHPAVTRKYLPFLITGVFFCLSLAGILHHEMWRDELQAWLVAREAHSLPALLQNLKYEGNPMLWHLFLFIITALTHNPFWMQIFHILIATAFVFLLNRYSPFTVVEKILITFGYYSFFEFNLISRSYGLGFLLVLIFCILYKNRRQKYLVISLVLFLLANTHVFGLMLSVCFSGILLIDYVQNVHALKFTKDQWPVIAFTFIILVAGWVASAAQIWPSADNSFPINYPDPAKQDLFHRFLIAFSRILPSYFALPKLDILHFWNSWVFEPTSARPGEIIPANASVNIYIPFLIFVIFSLYFLRKPILFILYTAGTLLFIFFFYYTFLLFSRYTSHLFVLLLAAMWLSAYYEEINIRNNFLDRLSRIGKSSGRVLFIVILAISFIGGSGAFYKDLIHPFSASGKLVDFLKKNSLEKDEIVAVPDWGVLAAASYLDRQCYYPYRKEHGSFIIFNTKRNKNIRTLEIIDQIIALNKKGTKRILLIQNSQLTYEDAQKGTEPISDAMISEDLQILLLNSIPAGIVASELYYIYLVKKKVVD